MHKNNLLILLTFVFIRSALAGLADFSFRAQGFDCRSSSIELSDEIKPSLNEINELAFHKLSSSSLNSFKKSSYPHADLETWIYIQNGTRFVLKALHDKKVQFKNLLADTYKRDHTSDFLSYLNNYNMAKSLQQSINELEQETDLCSSWQVWNIPERIFKGANCQSSEYNKIMKSEIENLLKELKEANPYLVHPLIESSLSKDELASISLPIFFRSSISEIEKQEQLMKKVSTTPASPKNLNILLSDTSIISTLSAFNYRPYLKKSKSVNLTKAKCIIDQKFLAYNSDHAIKKLGWDIFQVISPLAVYGKINLALKSLKSAKKLIRAKQSAREALVVSEALLLNLDSSLMNKASAECKNIQKNAAKLNLIPKVITRQLNECKDLADSLTTSKYLALIGGGVAIKLSKYDLQNMRLDRVFNQGKKLFHSSKSAVTSALVKQADIINAQIESLLPQPNLVASSTPTSQFNMSSKPSHLPGTLSLSRIKSDNYKVFKDKIEKFDCRGRRQCKRVYNKMKAGLLELGKAGEDGKLMALKLQKLVRTQDFFRLNKSLRALYHECLSILKCTVNEFNILFRMNKLKLSHTPHPHFYKRVLYSSRFDASPKDIIRNLTILERMKLNPKQGKVSGSFNKFDETDEHIIINGKKHSKDNEDSLSVKLSMERENKAFQLLAKKGFKVSIVPESAGRREQEGIQYTFERIAKAEKIGPTKNPDVILNGQYIADIYSPLQGLTPNNLRAISSNILRKIEGKPKKNSNNENSATEQNFRQTNRVIVYVDNIEGVAEDLVEEIRQMIGYEKPKHIIESFLLYEKNGKPQTLNIWP